MFHRHFMIAVALAAVCLTMDGPNSEFAARGCAKNPQAGAATHNIAARWYYRARRGGLNKRSTPSGRYNKQTLRPTNLA